MGLETMLTPLVKIRVVVQDSLGGGLSDGEVSGGLAGAVIVESGHGGSPVIGLDRSDGWLDEMTDVKMAVMKAVIRMVKVDAVFDRSYWVGLGDLDERSVGMEMMRMRWFFDCWVTLWFLIVA